MKTVNYAAGLVGVLVGLGFVCPQLSRLRVGEAISSGGTLLLLLGIILTLGGALAIGIGVRSQLAR